MLNPVIKPKGEGVKKRRAKAPRQGWTKEGKEGEEAGEPVADIDPMEKAKLVVGRVVEVGHVENSDKLYLCKVDAGEKLRDKWSPVCASLFRKGSSRTRWF